MLTDFLFLGAGILLLLFAGDALVRGAVAGALKAGVSPLVAGIVVVGFGTSLPEMLVSLEAALNGAQDLAHGNIVGSNIANLWLVVAVPAIIAPISTRTAGMGRSMVVTLIATVIWVALTYYYGLSIITGVTFLAALVLYVTFIVMRNRAEVAAGEGGDLAELEDEVGGDVLNMPIWKMALFIAIGLVGLVLGAQLAIRGGVGIARAFDVSEAMIGLTLLAVGTSLPEIGASVAAAMRRQGDVALGNVIGSNLFNLLGAGGVVGLVGHHRLADGFYSYSHWWLMIATLLVAYFVFTKTTIGRLTGILFLLLYSGYIYGLVAGVDFMSLPSLIIAPSDAPTPVAQP